MNEKGGKSSTIKMDTSTSAMVYLFVKENVPEIENANKKEEIEKEESETVKEIKSTNESAETDNVTDSVNLIKYVIGNVEIKKPESGRVRMKGSKIGNLLILQQDKQCVTHQRKEITVVSTMNRNLIKEANVLKSSKSCLPTVNDVHLMKSIDATMNVDQQYVRIINQNKKRFMQMTTSSSIGNMINNSVALNIEAVQKIWHHKNILEDLNLHMPKELVLSIAVEIRVHRNTCTTNLSISTIDRGITIYHLSVCMETLIVEFLQMAGISEPVRHQELFQQRVTR